MTDLPPLSGSSRPVPDAPGHEGPLLPGLARNAVAQLAARIGGGLVQAAALILVARSFGPGDFGLFALIFTLAALVTVVADWGLTLAGTRAIAYGRAETDVVLRTVLGLRLALAAAAIAVLEGLALASTTDRVVLTGALVAGLSFFPQAWFCIANIRAQLDLRLDRIAAASFAGNVATFAWIAGGLALGAGIVVLAAGLVVSALAGAAVATRLTPTPLPFVPRIDRRLQHELLRQSTPIAIALVLVTVYFYIDVILLARLSTADELGLYSAAYRFVQFAAFVPGVLVMSVYALAAELAERDRPRFAELVSELLSLAFLLVPLPLLLLAASAGEMMMLVFGAEFEAAASTLTLLSGAIAVMMLTGTLGPLLVAAGRERANLAIGAIAVVFNITANLFLIPRLAAAGAALATLLTELLVLALAVPLMHRVAPIKIGGRHAAKAAGSAAIAVAVVALLPAPLLIRLAVAMASYLAMLLLTKALGQRQLELTRMDGTSAA